jgi:hypothetical protein
MNMSEYKPASHRSKAQEAEKAREQDRRVKPVVTGQTKTKKNEGRKLINTFISEDAANVKSYVFMDVLVPAIKKAISDIVTNGIDMILYGETRGNRSSSGSKVSYRSYYDDRGNRGGSARSSYEPARSSGNRFDYDDVTFTTRRDAIAVREELYNISREYGFARVLDLYDLANITADYTASNYGWFHLDNVDVIQLRNGDWTLKLPKAMPIDRN